MSYSRKHQVEMWRQTKPFAPSQVIHILSQENPKRSTAKARFALYREGMTVQEYIDLAETMGQRSGIGMEDVRWDYASGFIHVE